MHIVNLRNVFCMLVLAVAGLFCAACGGSPERLDRRDERDPLIIRGDARKRAGDIDGAIELYQQALERKPQLALAHLKLGVEFDEAKSDYLRAIYHYSRYLELRPRAQKNDLVEKLVRQAHISYLASLPNPPPGAIERVAMLERENQRLKRQVEELSEQMRAARGVGSAPATAERATTTPRARATAPEAPTVRPQPAPAQPEMTTYRVERGDTLSRIAAKIYNDSTAWHKIYEANRDILPTPNSLREGQTLKIPPM